MKKEDFKKGMLINFDNNIKFKVIDTQYIDDMVIVECLNPKYMTSISQYCYGKCEEYIEETPIVEGTIYVYQDKKNPRKIIAKLKDSVDEYIGIAQCNPDDTFDYTVGANLAIERCLNAKNYWAEMNQKFMKYMEGFKE